MGVVFRPSQWSHLSSSASLAWIIVMALITRIVLATVLCFVLVNGMGRRGGRRSKNGNRRGSKKIANNKNGNNGGGLVTCPGFAGYCSESYPGDTCLVVCAFGRNNVPVCQEDGTWTDEPRCIEHEPGAPEQVPGTCPGVPGYCSLDLPGGLCTFECARGAHIRSSCLADGTWDPYPTCEGDVRETKDGCDPCPGPFGGPRNRTAEAGGRGGSGGSAATRGGSGSRTAAAPRGSASRRPSAGGSHGSRTSGSNRRNNSGSRRQSGSQRKSNRNSGKKNSSRRNSGGKRNQSSSRKSGGGRKSSSKSSGGCPDSVLEACIDACPGANAQIFGKCGR